MAFYLEKYADAQLFTVLKNLTYFEDAEDDPTPIMIEPIKWEEVKTEIVTAVSRFLNRN